MNVAFAVSAWIARIRLGTQGVDEQWLTTRQAGKLARWHPETVRRLIREGKIEARKVSGLVWLVNRASLLEYLRTRRGPGRPRRNA